MPDINTPHVYVPRWPGPESPCLCGGGRGAWSHTDQYPSVGRSKTEPEDQPMPTFSDRPFIHDLVAADIAARGELGKRRYGTKLQAFNGRSSLQDAYEESLDLCCYLKQLIEEEKELHG